jgi:formylglycine-generating enzyme required for sulfatase activity
MPRENYYLLLELDPAIRDITSIVAAIEKKQSEWSRDRNHPTKARQAQTNLNLISHIHKLMVEDLVTREIEAKDAEFQNRKQKNKLINELLELITVLAAPGFLLESQIVGISKQFQGKFSESEIRTFIKVPIKEDSLDSEKSGEVLDKVVFKEITDRLAIIGKNNLYDFLGLLQSSNLDALLEKAKELGRDITAYNSKTPDLAAKQELIGHCLSLFKNKLEKDKYDNSCSRQITSDFDQIISLSVQNNIIPASVMEKLLKLYGGKGVSIKDAKKYILDFASVRKWSVEVVKPEPSGNVKICSECGGSNNEKFLKCLQCGLSLFIKCPKCETLNQFKNKLCFKCNFNINLFREIELNPSDSQKYSERGLLFNGLLKYQDAIADLTKAIELDSKNWLAFSRRGFSNSKIGKYTEAISDFTSAIAISPNTSHLYMSRGNAYGIQKQTNEAINDFLLAIKLTPDDLNAQAGLRYFQSINQSSEQIIQWPFKYFINNTKSIPYFLLGILGVIILVISAYWFKSDKTIYGPSQPIIVTNLEKLPDKPNPGQESEKDKAGKIEAENKRKIKEEKDLADAVKVDEDAKRNKNKSDNYELELGMVLIPAGKFLMGSPASEMGRHPGETQHEVTITKPYYMGKYEVTQEQWERVQGNNPSRIKGAKFPVTNVSWHDCQEFIKKLNEKTKGDYRLPTEAEWEYACRAGTSTPYSFGESLPKSDANYGALEANTEVVGSYKPNAFGLFDMHGNVWEWCQDWYGYYPALAVTDPEGPASGTGRVFRGGSIGNHQSFARSSNRNFNPPIFQNNLLGFRLVRKAGIKNAVVPTVTKPDPAEKIPAKGDLLESPFSDAKAKEKQKEIAIRLQKEVEEKEDLGKGNKLEMVLIPSGKFRIGSPPFEMGRLTGETQHEVTITKPYYMGKYEVTQEQWENVMGDNPSATKGAKLPVTNVSWHDCQEFIKKLNTKTNGGYRLPTEAEWEYACRAGTTTAYSYGASLTKSDANIDGASIKPIGNYKPNAFGLFDMHGNVWEWCEDWYSDYSAGSVTDPNSPATGENRVMRGGSFVINESFARSSTRGILSPASRSGGGGLRLARTADFKTADTPKDPKSDLAKLKQEEESIFSSIKKDMVLIPAGKFEMGSAVTEKGRSNFETLHVVKITNPYYMGKYEVTQEQWQTVMGNNPSQTKGAKLPVTGVSWHNCQEFIKKLNTKTDGDYRLPTEAEWEYSCKAGTTTAYSFGDTITPNDANCDISNIGKPVEVGRYNPNSFGVHDMHGNVREWCEDWFEDYNGITVTDPQGTAIGFSRVMRGGAFDGNTSNARSSARYNSTPTLRYISVGFRLAK